MERVAAKNFQDLIVWQKVHQFVLSIYTYNASFPKTDTLARLITIETG
jgi:hypothetical protein